MPEKTTSDPPAPALANLNIQVLAMLRAFSMILSARLLLLLAVAGAFALAVMAEIRGGPMNLAVLVAFCVLTVVPLVWMDHASRQRPRSE